MIPHDPETRDTPKRPWRVEQYDRTWGGWRFVTAAFDDDSPAAFASERTAVAAMRLQGRFTRAEMRVRKVDG